MQPSQSRNGVLAVRVSSARQGIDGDSPEAQREQGERFAELHNIKVIKTLAYHESASKEEQPMQDVVDYCKRHKKDVDVVIIKSIDRLTRGGSYFYENLKRQLDALNIALIDIYGVVSYQKVNTLDHLGFKYRWSEYSPSRKTELLEAERANDELRDILSRMIGSEIRYTQLGYWNREAPYGFAIEKVETVNGKRAVLKGHPRESAHIRKLFELRAQGTLHDNQIADELNRMGFKTRVKIIRNKKDRTQIIAQRGGKPMTAKLLRSYVKKTIYAGINTETWTGGKPVRCKFDGLVSIELFNKANHGKIYIDDDGSDHPTVSEAPKLEKMAKKNKYNPDFPYRRVVKCPHCDHALLGSASRGRLGKYYPAYHCSNHGHYFRVPKPEFESVMQEFVKSMIVRPERIDELMNAVLTVWEARQAQVKQQEEFDNKRKEELEAKMRVIVDKMQLVSSETALKYMEDDLMKLERQLADVDSKKLLPTNKKLVDIPTVLTYVKYFMEHLYELLIDHCNPLTRADYFGVLFDEVSNYEEIKAGTKNASLVPGLNEVFKLAKMDNVLLVHEGERTRLLIVPLEQAVAALSGNYTSLDLKALTSLLLYSAARS